MALPGVQERARSSIRVPGRQVVQLTTAVVVAFLVIPPLAVLLFSAVRSTQNKLPFEATEFTLGNLTKIFGSPITYQLLLNTAWYAIGSVVVALALAVTFAWFLERTNMPCRQLLFMLTLVPIGIPGIVLSIAWIMLANPVNGVFNLALRSLFTLQGQGPLEIYSMPGMILITAIRFVPVMFLMISGVFSRIDPSLEEAARTSGSRPWDTFKRISVPLLGPALLGAGIYYLVFGVEVFEAAALLGAPRGIYVLATAIYDAARPIAGFPDYGLASAYGLLLLVAAAALVYGYRRHIGRGERFATVTGRGYRPRLIDLGRWRYVPAVLMGAYFVVVVVMPVLILVWKSVAPPYADISVATLPELSLNNYVAVAKFPGLFDGVRNTLVISLATACLTMLIVTLLSWQSVRGQGGRITAYSEYLAFAVLGIPGIVLALSATFIYAALPLPVYGTTWIIVICLTTLSLPFGTRLMNAAMGQIHHELEEASATSGANSSTTLRQVVLPLLWPSLTRGFLWVFVRGIGDATVSIMLLTRENQTVAAVLWSIWVSEGNFPVVAAISVPMVVFSSILALLVGRQTMLRGASA